MNEQMNITTFHELLNSDLDKGSLLDVLRGLTEISDPSDFNMKNGPKPLGAWSGWSY
jgi:hypothetical protein